MQIEVINFLKMEQHEDLKSFLLFQGFKIYELDTAGIVNMSLFYNELISSLPVGIPLSGSVHWDAFLDSVWEGITERGYKKVALIWIGSNDLQKVKLSDYMIVIDIFQQLSTTLKFEEPRCDFASFILE